MGVCVGPTLDWHLNPNKYHIVCAKKRLLLAVQESVDLPLNYTIVHLRRK